jgi:succinoglycan biosynthesis transport protein ExoP
MALEEYLNVVKRWWWLLVLSTLVAAVSSYFAVSREPRTYQATTTTIIGQSLEKANPTYEDFSISQQLARTYVNIVQRRVILEGAAQALGLPYIPRPGNVSASIVPGTQLLEISIRDSSPQRAQALADEIARQLILQTPTDSAEEQSRREFAQKQLDNLKANIEATEAEIEEEQARLDAANSARAIQQYQVNITALQQKLSNYQSTYASLLGSVEGGTNDISIWQYAELPTQPISPNVPQTVLIAAGIGLSLALGGAFLIEFLDNTVRTSEELRRATSLPILGTVGRIEGNGLERRLVVADEPRSRIAEAYRALRTNIQFSSVDAPVRTLLVTSPGPYEGKSVTVANLAVTVAQSGRPVILVDADLRRPRLHKLFRLDNEHGLSNAILANSDEGGSALGQLSAAGNPEDDLLDRLGPLDAQCLQETGIPNLRVITSGPVPPNPADLLGSERMHALIHALAEQADYLLFDSPPALAVTDAAILSTRVDGVLLVADAGRTRRALAGRAVEELGRVDARVLGTVLNRASLRQSGYYAPYYYDTKGDQVRDRGLLSTVRGWLFGRADGSDKHRRKEPQPVGERADDARGPPDEVGGPAG